MDRTVIFKVDILDDVDDQILHALKSGNSNQKTAKNFFSLLDLMPFTSEDRETIRTKLISPVIYRVILGLALVAVVYFVVFLFFLLSVKTEDMVINRLFVYALLTVCAVIYLARTVKT